MLNLRSKKWTHIEPTGGVPSGRSSLVAQIYQNSLFVFGGYNGHVVLNDFFEFPFQSITVEPPRLLNDLKKLVNHDTFHDVTFVVEGRLVHAVRAVLAIRSEHFRALLYGGMRESIDNDEPIALTDIQYDVFCKVLEYLYTDHVQISDSNEAMTLLIAADLFLLPRLKSLCEEVILQGLSLDNAIHWLLQAFVHNATSLLYICLDFIVDNIAVLKANPQFQLLKQEPELLMEILMRSSTRANKSNSTSSFCASPATSPPPQPQQIPYARIIIQNHQQQQQSQPDGATQQRLHVHFVQQRPRQGGPMHPQQQHQQQQQQQQLQQQQQQQEQQQQHARQEAEQEAEASQQDGQTQQHDGGDVESSIGVRRIQDTHWPSQRVRNATRLELQRLQGDNSEINSASTEGVGSGDHDQHPQQLQQLQQQQQQ